MIIFTQLKNNKGTVSSALGKKLAKKVLDGNIEILKEAVKLTCFEPEIVESKTIRAGAAKIIEKVAEKKPELVAGYLEELLPALDMIEPQTRWMIFRVMGFCAKLNPEISKKGINRAKQYLRQNSGVCLAGSIYLYLGDVGAVSKNDADLVFPILKKALNNAKPNEIDWILEAFINIFQNLNKSSQKEIIKLSKIYLEAPKKSTQKRVDKIIKLV